MIYKWFSPWNDKYIFYLCKKVKVEICVIIKVIKKKCGVMDDESTEMRWWHLKKWRSQSKGGSNTELEARTRSRLLSVMAVCHVTPTCSSYYPWAQPTPGPLAPPTNLFSFSLVKCNVTSLLPGPTFPLILYLNTLSFSHCIACINISLSSHIYITMFQQFLHKGIHLYLLSTNF